MIYAFIGIYAGTILTLFIAFGLIRYRYVIWRGYFKATFDSELGTFDKIVKLPPGANSFTMKFRGIEHEYQIEDGKLSTTRKWQLPHGFYIVGCSEPLHYRTAKLDSKVSSQRYSELRRTKVIREVFDAFKTEAFSTTSAALLTVLVTVGGFLVLGWYLNQKLSEIATAVGVVS